MDFKKTIFLLVGFLFFFSLLVTLPTVATSQTITLKYANFPPATNLSLRPDGGWKKEVEKRTNGKVKVQTFPGRHPAACQKHLRWGHHRDSRYRQFCHELPAGPFPRFRGDRSARWIYECKGRKPRSL